MWRIKNWNEIFENSQSRKYENISWVPIPNKHDSDGFTQLIEHEHGLLHYGAWILLVQVASRCQPRGLLTRGNGKPHDCQSLARITRVGAHAFNEAIPRFLDLDWIEEVDNNGCSQSAGSTLGECYPERTERKEKKELTRPAGSPVGILESWDSETWQKARTLANVACRKLWPNRRRESRLKPKDRELLIKAAYLANTRLSEAWFQKALDETVHGEPKKPVAFFKTMLWKQPRSAGLNLNELLDEIKIPDSGAMAVGDAVSEAEVVFEVDKLR